MLGELGESLCAGADVEGVEEGGSNGAAPTAVPSSVPCSETRTSYSPAEFRATLALYAPGVCLSVVAAASEPMDACTTNASPAKEQNRPRSRPPVIMLRTKPWVGIRIREGRSWGEGLWSH